MNWLRRILAIFLLQVPAIWCTAQNTLAIDTDDKPLPDIPTLMHQVEANQRAAESIEKDYIYRRTNQFDELDRHDGIKKTRTRESEVFWINGVEVRRTLKIDGKELTPDERKKESERIDQVVEKARQRRDKADQQGKETDSHGNQEITVARILELGTFSNARREVVNGRDTIVVDYLGDPKAKTHNSAEAAFKELAGTLWIDEQDHTIQHLEGHFDHDFKLLGGLAVDVKQGTWFKAAFAKINDEVWLPASLEADGHARYLLFFSLNGHLQSHTSDYRKFKATSTILPGAAPVTPEPETAPPAASPKQ